MVAEAQKKAAAKDVAGALKGGAALAVALSHLDRMEPAPPARRRYISNDATIEKLGELLRDNPRGVLIFFSRRACRSAAQLG